MIKLRSTLLAFLIAAGMSTTPATASAAQIDVNTVVDEFNVNAGACSLREAIQSANADSAAQSPGCAAGSGADAIVLRSGNYRTSRAGADDDTNVNGDFDIGGAHGPLSISSVPGADVVLSNGLSGQAVIQVLAGANASLNGFTITGGDGTFGGALANAGTATLSNLTIRANHASVYGGGIRNSGTMSVDETTVANNNSDVAGGGIQQASSGSLSVVRSTIRNNFAASFGGAIQTGGPVQIDRSVITGNTSAYIAGGLEVLATVSISNSTIDGNKANYAGGIEVASAAGALTLINSTVERNSATDAAATIPRGGGIYQADPAVVTLQDSIVALNTDASSVPGPDCRGTVTSLGHSLLGSNQNCTYASGPGDILNVDPQLGPLADNGGPTKSAAPLATSPAIDAGASSLSTDQRGSPRPVDNLGVPNSANGSDIGSVEMAAPPPGAPPTPGAPPPPGDTTPPQTTITKAKISQGTHKVTVAFASSEPGSLFECKLDKKPTKTCASPMTYKKLKPGKHLFQVVARDVAGNIDPTPATKKFKIKR